MATVEYPLPLNVSGDFQIDVKYHQIDIEHYENGSLSGYICERPLTTDLQYYLCRSYYGVHEVLNVPLYYIFIYRNESKITFPTSYENRILVDTCRIIYDSNNPIPGYPWWFNANITLNDVINKSPYLQPGNQSYYFTPMYLWFWQPVEQIKLNMIFWTPNYYNRSACGDISKVKIAFKEGECKSVTENICIEIKNNFSKPPNPLVLGDYERANDKLRVIKDGQNLTLVLEVYRMIYYVLGVQIKKYEQILGTYTSDDSCEPPTYTWKQVECSKGECPEDTCFELSCGDYICCYGEGGKLLARVKK